MKECINPACRHLLEDYERVCSYCGVTQKTKETLEAKTEEKETVETTYETADDTQSNTVNLPLPRRHPVITIFLSIGIALNALAGLDSLSPLTLFNGQWNAFHWPYLIHSIFYAINVASLILLLCRKRIGFILLAGSCLVSTILLLKDGWAVPWALISLAVYFALLQIRTNRISYWKTLSW